MSKSHCSLGRIRRIAIRPYYIYNATRTQMLKCYRCRRIVSPDSRSTPHGVCPFCSTAFHCCMNCLYYDESSPYKCSESAADWVPDKEKANFCQYFEYLQPEI